jgi:hypothetical protein
MYVPIYTHVDCIANVFFHAMTRKKRQVVWNGINLKIWRVHAAAGRCAVVTLDVWRCDVWRYDAALAVGDAMFEHVWRQGLIFRQWVGQRRVGVKWTKI